MPTAFQSSYLLAIPLLWSILRFSQIITALIVFENTFIGVWGLIEKQGFFVGMDLQANLILFWAYFMVMALISLIASFIVNERNMLYQAIMITNKDNLIIRVNKAFCDITGYQADEVLGHHPDILNSDSYNELFYAAFWDRLHDDKVWKGEVYSGRKNGGVYLQSLTIKLLHDEQGQIEHYLAMFMDITQQRSQALHFKQLAEFDHLTILANRVLLQQSFQAALALAKRHDKQLAVLYIDLNDFKPINDTYGHAMGDIVLQHVASRMRNCIRDSDTAARIGGDEFSVLLNDLDDLAICQTMVEKLKQVIAEPITEDEITVQVTASIGVANYPEQGDSLEALLNYADLSMYTDKEKMKQV